MIESVADIFNTTAKYIIPLLLTAIPFYALVFKKVKVYEVFTEGAKGQRNSRTEVSNNHQWFLIQQPLIQIRIKRRIHSDITFRLQG
jgi:hypothetical protein